MNSLNSILLEGNVVRDAIYKETAKGTPICSFTIASNRFFKTESGEFDQEVSFFEIETWGKLAEACNKSCSKGRGVRVVGRLKQGRWKDDSGANHSKIAVIAEHVEFKPVFSNSKNDNSSSKTKAYNANYAKQRAINPMDEVAVF